MYIHKYLEADALPVLAEAGVVLDRADDHILSFQ